MSTSHVLSELDRAILEFESTAPRAVGRKEEAIRATFDISPVRYHQRLNFILENPAAMEAFPALVGRLRRVRAQRDDIRRAAHENE